MILEFYWFNPLLPLSVVILCLVIGCMRNKDDGISALLVLCGILSFIVFVIFSAKYNAKNINERTASNIGHVKVIGRFMETKSNYSKEYFYKVQIVDNEDKFLFIPYIPQAKVGDVWVLSGTTREGENEDRLRFDRKVKK